MKTGSVVPRPRRDGCVTPFHQRARPRSGDLGDEPSFLRERRAANGNGARRESEFAVTARLGRIARPRQPGRVALVGGCGWRSDVQRGAIRRVPSQASSPRIDDEQLPEPTMSAA